MTSQTADRMREIVRRWIDEGWRKGDVGVVDRLHSRDFVDHDPGGRPPDNEGFKRGIADLFTAFPDLETTVHETIADPGTGLIAVRWSAAGTHRGPYLGAEPTGRRIRLKGIEILRIRYGLISERWGEWDGIDLLDQLGRLER